MEFRTPNLAWNYEIETINSVDLNPQNHQELSVASSDSTNSNIYLRIWNINFQKLYLNKQDFAKPILEISTGH